MATYETHVGLLLRWENERVTIEGDRVKLLYPIDEDYDAAEAQAVYDAVQEHYEQRKFAQEEGAKTSPEEAQKKEAQVGFIRTSGPEWKEKWAAQRVQVDEVIGRGK